MFTTILLNNPINTISVRLFFFILFIVILHSYSYGQRSVYPIGNRVGVNQLRGTSISDSVFLIPWYPDTPTSSTARVFGSLIRTGSDSSVVWVFTNRWNYFLNNENGIIQNALQQSDYSYNFTLALPSSLNRDGIGSVVVENKWFYEIGGWAPSRVNPNRSDSSVFRAPLDSLGTLTQLADAPWRGRHTFGCESRNDSIFVFLGDDRSGYIQHDAWVAKVDTSDGALTWYKLTDSAANSNRILYAAFQHKGWFYYIGGQITTDGATGSDGAVIRTTNFQSGTYQTVATGLRQFKSNLSGCGASFNGYIYIISGGVYNSDNSKRTYGSDIWRSADDGVHWEYRGKLPGVGTQYSYLQAFDNKLFLIGGFNRDSQGVYRVLYMDASENWYPVSTAAYPSWNSGRYAIRGATFIDSNNIQNFVTVGGNSNGQNWVITAEGNTLSADTVQAGKLEILNIPEYADNAAALLGGLLIGDTYRTGDVLKIVH
jgi:hypothetical protein